MTHEEAKKMGATHKAGRTLVKNLRENTPNDGAYSCGYIYAYDFFDGKRWHGCAMVRLTTGNPKTLDEIITLSWYYADAMQAEADKRNATQEPISTIKCKHETDKDTRGNHFFICKNCGKVIDILTMEETISTSMNDAKLHQAKVNSKCSKVFNPWF